MVTAAVGGELLPTPVDEVDGEVDEAADEVDNGAYWAARWTVLAGWRGRDQLRARRRPVGEEGIDEGQDQLGFATLKEGRRRRTGRD